MTKLFLLSVFICACAADPIKKSVVDYIPDKTVQHGFQHPVNVKSLEGYLGAPYYGYPGYHGYGYAGFPYAYQGYPYGFPYNYNGFPYNYNYPQNALPVPVKSLDIPEPLPAVKSIPLPDVKSAPLPVAKSAPLPVKSAPLPVVKSAPLPVHPAPAKIAPYHPPHLHHDALQYLGVFDGTCSGKADGLYYVDSRSFAFCSGGIKTIQACAEGSINPPLADFSSGKYQHFYDFCSINVAASIA